MNSLKEIAQKIVPTKLWVLLKFIKNNLHKFENAKNHLQEYGLLHTLKKIRTLQKRQQLDEIEISQYTQPQQQDFILEAPSSSTTHLRIAIVVHVFYLDKVENILEYIQNIPYNYSLYFTVSEEKRASLEKILQSKNLFFKIKTFANQGYDIAPFISLLPFLKEKKYDLVCKIHTKKGAANLEEELVNIENLWSDLLLNPLLGSRESVQKIIEAFQTNQDLGMVSSADLFKSSQKWMYGNEVYVSKILMLFNKNIDPAQEWGFNAGTIFWARMDIFEDIIKHSSQIEMLFSHDFQMSTGSFASSFHAMERVFGLLPKIANMKHAISYATDKKRETHSLQLLKSELSYASHLGVGYTLENEYNLSKNYSYIQETKSFDTHYYFEKNIEVQFLQMDPLLHFLRYGLYQNREPQQGFSPFRYLNENPHLLEKRVNPFIDFLQNKKPKKKRLLQKTQSASKKKQKTIQCNLPNNVKRVSLFAAYDKDGIIDASVILFVKELSKHSDVYFLSDSNLQNGELQKLKEYTKGAWGIRHGEYDFGSYKRLANYLVGWEILQTYDELILVNDSSYLLKPLDTVFEKMHTKPCSWWGLQATKGMYHTQKNRLNQFKEKIPLKKVKEELLDIYAQDKVYDFHVASYFLVFRKPLLEDGVLQEILQSVQQEKSKKEIILKYEIGITKSLIEKGYDFDTFMDDLYPFHPLYTNVIFEMVEDGFPLFKRFFLSENHYKVENLYQWKEKLKKIIPTLDFTPIEENLYRVSDATQLYHNLHITKKTPKILSNRAFKKADKITKIDSALWIFPVCAYDHTLSGNERAIFETIKENKYIKKVILFRSKKIELEGSNVSILPLQSREAQECLLQASTLFIKHTPRENILYPLDAKKHKFINLWHGIPLKRIGTASIDLESNFHIIAKENQQYHSVIASSSIDRLAMTSAFYPLTYHDIWVTGLPRNDFVLQESKELPKEFQKELHKLQLQLNGKNFILYAPTFRNKQKDGYYNFTTKEKQQLYSYLEETNTILGIREHMADTEHSYSSNLQHPSIINVGSLYYPNIEILYREANILITDYSSCFIDFMLTGKPMISFAYDYENYIKKERGLFYDLEFAFAGNIAKTFDALLQEVIILTSKKFEKDPSYQYKQKMFFDYIDCNNSQRVIERLLQESKI